jgi:hypothetical protein
MNANTCTVIPYSRRVYVGAFHVSNCIYRYVIVDEDNKKLYVGCFIHNNVYEANISVALIALKMLGSNIEILTCSEYLCSTMSGDIDRWYSKTRVRRSCLQLILDLIEYSTHTVNYKYVCTRSGNNIVKIGRRYLEGNIIPDNGWDIVF